MKRSYRIITGNISYTLAVNYFEVKYYEISFIKREIIQNEKRKFIFKFTHFLNIILLK